MDDNLTMNNDKLNPRARNVAIGSLIAIMLTVGAYMTLPVFLVPFSQIIGVSIGEVAIMFSATAICSMVVALSFGTVLKKLGVKKICILAGIVQMIGYALMYLALVTRNVYLLYVGCGILAFATVAGGFAIAQTCITFWFVKRHGTVVSLISVTNGVSVFIFAPLAGLAMQRFEVTTLLLMIGFVFGGLVILNAVLLLSEHPATYGMKPYGYVEVEKTADDGKPAAADNTLTKKQMISTAAFWLVLFATCLSSLANMGFRMNAAAYYQYIGVTALQSSFGISIASIVGIGGALLFGLLVDKKGPIFTVVLYSAIAAIGFGFASVASGVAGMVIVAVLTGGIGVFSLLPALMLSRIFGAGNIGSVIGFGVVAGSLGSMIGSPTAGFIYTNLGTYVPFMFVAIASLVLVVLCVVIAGRKKLAETV